MPPDESELLARIESDDEDLRMPPNRDKWLTVEEVENVRRWIERAPPGRITGLL